MIIAKKLGLTEEVFARMVVKTKMLFSNVIGHAAELHYEKYLTNEKIKFKKAEVDRHFDYLVKSNRVQVKRWETAGTDISKLVVNLTQTHGDRSGEGNFYNKNSFDILILYDVLFKSFQHINMEDIDTNKKFNTHIVGKFKILRNTENQLDDDQLDFLKLMKIKNKDFPKAVDDYIDKKKLNYMNMLQKSCNLKINEIDSLFSIDNFRLITGAKGFAAEEHFNVLLDKNDIKYKQDKDMYSKVDHWVNDKRVQVKIPHLKSVNESRWAFKTHKSHGAGVKELYRDDEFDYVALFIGFKMNYENDKYLPVSVSNDFIIIPTTDLQIHPNYPGHLKRVSTFPKNKYIINDLSLLK